MTTRAEPLTAVDAAFLSIEKPTVHMHIGGLSIFDPSTRSRHRLSFGEYRRHLAARLDRLPRHRQLLRFDAFGWGGPRWADDPAFDLDLHLVRDALPSPGGDRELMELAGWVMSQPLDRAKPLWENHFVEGLSGGRIAILMKAHHALEDGLAGLRQTEIVFDPVRRPAPPERPNHVIPELRPASAVGTAAAAAAGVVAYLGSGLLAPASPLNGQLGVGRAVAVWHAPLREAKAIHHSLGISFNDLLLAVAAGGLRRYFSRRGELPPKRVRVLVPVSTRKAEDRATGNQVSAFLLDLDLDWSSATQAARRISAASHRTRNRDEALAFALLEDLGGRVAPVLQGITTRWLFGHRLFNLIVSDVRGLERPLFLLGARHLASYPLMPLGEGCGLSVAALTMGGVLGVGITCDPRLVPEPEELAKGMQDAYRELRRESGPSVRQSAGPTAHDVPSTGEQSQVERRGGSRTASRA